MSSQERISRLSRKNKSIYKKELLRVEIFILLGVTFFTYFNQTSLETIVIPFTEVMFGWSELGNSILFCVGGGVIIASYVIIRLLSHRRISDRCIMIAGLAIIATGLAIACACMFYYINYIYLEIILILINIKLSPKIPFFFFTN